MALRNNSMTWGGYLDSPFPVVTGIQYVLAYSMGIMSNRLLSGHQGPIKPNATNHPASSSSVPSVATSSGGQLESYVLKSKDL
ncbi:hypothetical protein AgCh_022136 [Apium graveolens]